MASAMIHQRNEELKAQMEYLRKEEERLSEEIKSLTGPRTYTKKLTGYSSSECSECSASSSDDSIEITSPEKTSSEILPSTSNSVEKTNPEKTSSEILPSTSNNNINEITEITNKITEAIDEHKNIDDTNKINAEQILSISSESNDRYITISAKTPKRKLDAIINDMQQNTKKYKEDEMPKIISKLVNQMKKMDKRLENLESKFIEKEHSSKTLEKNIDKNSNKGENIPSIIKAGKSHVVVALRDYWMPVMNKRFDSIESRFDRIESRFDSIESLMKQ